MGMNNNKALYLNKPQFFAYAVRAKETYLVWARGVGKTSGALNLRVVENVKRMPRSVGGMIGASYQQHKTRTLPSLLTGLERAGYVRGIHYVFGTRPPKHWPTAYEAPLAYSNFFSFRNGAGMHLISQDIKGGSNGLNLDWIIGDEAKLLNYEQYQDETMPTIRANRLRWQHLSCHHSQVFTTSMPSTPSGKWILEKSKLADPVLIQLIYDLEMEYQEALRVAGNLQSSDSARAKANRIIRRSEKELDALRRQCVFYSEASALDNIEVLGEEYIRTAKRNMMPFLFNTEILNIKPGKVDGVFYPALEGKVHMYRNAYNTGYLETIPVERVVNDYHADKSSMDCRQDIDIDKSKPLYLAIDWGARINCLNVSQKIGREIRILKSMFVLSPKILDDLATDFCDYYSHHGQKHVIMVAGHDGRKGQANSVRSYSQQFADILRKRGWIVSDETQVFAPRHSEKFLLVNKILKEDGRGGLAYVRINEFNCSDLITSLFNAPAIDWNGEIKKNKESERDEDLPQNEATHLSDTFDMILMYHNLMIHRTGSSLSGMGI